jgi:hypothetical protein
MNFYALTSFRFQNTPLVQTVRCWRLRPLGRDARFITAAPPSGVRPVSAKLVSRVNCLGLWFYGRRFAKMGVAGHLRAGKAQPGNRQLETLASPDGLISATRQRRPSVEAGSPWDRKSARLCRSVSNGIWERRR